MANCNIRGVNNPKYKHGYVGTPEYRAWKNIKNRCNNPNASNYEYYGGRGIVVCEKWLNDFLSFFNDVGERPSSSHSLDRIDNNGHYEPNNCKWSTREEQGRNKRNNKFLLMEDGRKLTLSEASKELGLSISTLWSRRVK